MARGTGAESCVGAQARGSAAVSDSAWGALGAGVAPDWEDLVRLLDRHIADGAVINWEEREDRAPGFYCHSYTFARTGTTYLLNFWATGAREPRVWSSDDERGRDQIARHAGAIRRFSEDATV